MADHYTLPYFSASILCLICSKESDPSAINSLMLKVSTPSQYRSSSSSSLPDLLLNSLPLPGAISTVINVPIAMMPKKSNKGCFLIVSIVWLGKFVAHSL